MKHYILPAILIAVSPDIFQANAEGIYGDLGYTRLSVDNAFFGQLDDNAAIGHLGYQFNEYFAIESELGLGIGEEDEFIPEVGVTANHSLNYTAGILGRVQYPVLDSVQLFARGGLSMSELEASASFPEYSAIGAVTLEKGAQGLGLTAGVGAEYQITPKLYLRGEYTNYNVKDTTANSLGLSLGYRFGATD